MSNTPTGWQPIETAPRDRTVILLWDDYDKVVVSGQWDVDEDDRGYWSAYGHYRMMACRKPTHWMPTPAGPTAGDTMSDMTRFGQLGGMMGKEPYGDWVRYTDHVAAVTRLIDEIARVNRRVDEEAETDRITAERNAARAEVERLEAEVERLTVERDAAYISIESLRNALAEQDHELDMAREDVLRLTSERDAARAEIERLRANGQETRDSSRPDYEDLWREGFKRQVAEYRKQWGWSR